jgi:hypothetical protein
MFKMCALILFLRSARKSSRSSELGLSPMSFPRFFALAPSAEVRHRIAEGRVAYRRNGIA